MCYKFSLVAFSDITSQINKEFTINEIKVLPGFPYKVDEHWTRWLGSLRSDEIFNSNLTVLSIIPTDKPQIYDDEHKIVQVNVFEFYYSLMLYGIPEYQTANLLTGSVYNNQISIREVSSLDIFHVGFKRKPHILTQLDLNKIGILHRNLLIIFNEKFIEDEQYFRLRHGLNAYFKAIKERENYYRIHQFVRAIEAIILPKIGQTKKQFMHKCKTFVVANQNSEKFLSEIYDLRSKVEHLHPLTEVFEGLSNKESLKLIDLRIRMVEEIARNVLVNILSKGKLLVSVK